MNTIRFLEAFTIGMDCVALLILIVATCTRVFFRKKLKQAIKRNKFILLKPLVLPYPTAWKWADYNSRAIFVETADGRITMFSHEGKEVAQIILPKPGLRFAVSEDALTTDYYGEKTVYRLSEIYDSMGEHNCHLPDSHCQSLSIKRHSTWVYIRSSANSFLLRKRDIFLFYFPVLISLLCNIACDIVRSI